MRSIDVKFALKIGCFIAFLKLRYGGDIPLRRRHSVTEGTFDNLGDCRLMVKVNDRDFSVMKNILFVYIKKNLEEKILSIMCSCAILTGVTEGTKKGP